MAELRKDYLLNDYVIIAQERAKRPDQFKGEKPAVTDSKNCPFCPENEAMIPGVLEETGKPWRVRAIPNKFFAVKQQGNPNVETHNEFYTFASGFGTHEVIIETPKHGQEIHELSDEHLIEILKMYQSRIKANLDIQGIIYPSLFKNKGAKAGASISHSHTQLISFNIKPQTIHQVEHKSKEYFVANNHCAYCSIINKELNSQRHISFDQRFFVYAPYASQYAMQFNIIPKRHVNNIMQLNDEELVLLSQNLRKYIGKLEKLGDVSYNILFMNFYDEEPYNHFQIIVAPRFNTFAGFEKQTGTIINPTPPEVAAEYYRE